VHWLACAEPEVPPDDAWLAPAEAARAAGLRFPKRLSEYRLRRWAGKRAVAAVTGLGDGPRRLAAVEILNHPDGAPLARFEGAPLPLEISLTDRAGVAVCLVAAVDEGGPVGVDLELVEPRSPAFVEDFLTAAERDHVLSLPRGEARDAAATLVWSAKESALKVLRTGLRADTRTVEVTAHAPVRPDGWGALDIGTTGGRALTGWWRRDGALLLTVATSTPAAPPSRLDVP
jgi:4'-phosphopantetheinyl transferase